MRRNLPMLAAAQKPRIWRSTATGSTETITGHIELANAEDARRVLRRHDDDEGRFVADGQFQAQVRAR
jgi:hypothetical protein